MLKAASAAACGNILTHYIYAEPRLNEISFQATKPRYGLERFADSTKDLETPFRLE